jgi:Holliday junction resolvasome RuvABC DNA-binding subunit
MRNYTTTTHPDRLVSLGYAVATIEAIKKIANEFKDSKDAEALKDALKEIEWQCDYAIAFDKEHGGK